MVNAFSGKVVIVTGAGRGMGRAIAESFAERGAKVVIGARTLHYGEETVAQFAANGWDAMLAPCDCASQPDIRRMVDRAVDRYGRLDILVHCAAESPGGPFLDVSDEAIDAALQSSVKAAHWLARAAVPHLKASGAGRMVFISSICGPSTIVPGKLAYAITKSGINTFVRGAGLELATTGITVNGVEPGVTWTDRTRAHSDDTLRAAVTAMIPMNRFAEAREIAAAVRFLASDEAGYITGQTIVVDGGMTLTSSGYLALGGLD